MKIDPKHHSFQVPPDQQRIDSARETASPEQAKTFSDQVQAGKEDVSRVNVDPLESRLTEMIQNKDLDDPKEKLEVSLLVMRETLLSVFGESFLQGLDMETMLDTFRDFVENDPSLQAMFDHLLHSLANASE
jgi:hypothetical protein